AGAPCSSTGRLHFPVLELGCPCWRPDRSGLERDAGPGGAAGWSPGRSRPAGVLLPRNRLLGPRGYIRAGVPLLSARRHWTARSIIVRPNQIAEPRRAGILLRKRAPPHAGNWG